MDKLKKYSKILQFFFEDRQAIQNRQASGLKAHLLINRQKTDFILLKMGWMQKLFIHAVVFHLEIKNNKIWIYEDKTDIDVANILVEKGIAKKDIVLGFLSPTLREFSEYAVT
ncbi:MAG: element excision factor XisI family protein [Saprospiraceae bacterium]